MGIPKAEGQKTRSFTHSVLPVQPWSPVYGIGSPLFLEDLDPLCFTRFGTRQDFHAPRDWGRSSCRGWEQSWHTKEVFVKQTLICPPASTYNYGTEPLKETPTLHFNRTHKETWAMRAYTCSVRLKYQSIDIHTACTVLNMSVIGRHKYCTN